MLLGTTGRCLYFAERPKHFQLPAVSAHTYVHLERRRRKGALPEEKETVFLRTAVFSKKNKNLPLATGKRGRSHVCVSSKNKMLSIHSLHNAAAAAIRTPSANRVPKREKNNGHSGGIFAAHRGHQIWLTQQRNPRMLLQARGP